MKLFNKLLAGLLLAAALIGLVSAPVLAQTAVVISTGNTGNKVQTYRTAFSSWTLAASPTDIFFIQGSSTKTVYVKSITFSAVATTSASAIELDLFKRTTANINGAAGTLTNGSLDSLNGASTAVAKIVTANMTLGTGVMIGTRAMQVAAPASTSGGERIVWTCGEWINQYCVLRGTAESLALNMGGTTLTGGKGTVEVEWMEQ